MPCPNGRWDEPSASGFGFAVEADFTLALRREGSAGLSMSDATPHSRITPTTRVHALLSRATFAIKPAAAPQPVLTMIRLSTITGMVFV